MNVRAYMIAKRTARRAMRDEKVKDADILSLCHDAVNQIPVETEEEFNELMDSMEQALKDLGVEIE
jgi:hypothetical protein